MRRSLHFQATPLYLNLSKMTRAHCMAKQPLEPRQHLSNFEAQLVKISKMLELDKDVISEAIKQLAELKEGMIKADFGNHHHYPTATIDLLEGLIRSGANRNKYISLFNQSIVLSVSYFSSTISAIFCDSLWNYLNTTKAFPNKLKKKSVKFSLAELYELNFGFSNELGRMVSRKDNISFQDTKSIKEAFNDYFNVEIQRDKNVDNIIAALSLRHAIAHNSEIIDEKCYNMLEIATNREFILQPKKDSQIKINGEELDIIMNSMKIYITSLVEQLEQKTLHANPF